MSDFPVRFSDTEASIRHLQPRLGEQSEEILREAGLSDDAIAALIEAKAVSTR
jgi:crotonobetainyl-CoA:carnitine CoA-transferase CaiB-like acyl-CoA transferase